MEVGVTEALEALPKVMDRLGEQKEDGTFTNLADMVGKAISSRPSAQKTYA